MLPRLFLALAMLSTLHAQAAEVLSARMWSESDTTRVVFDLSGPVKYQTSILANPHRVVIDLPQGRLDKPLGNPARQGHLANIRSGYNGKKELRLVLDLHQAVRVKSFLTPPSQGYGHRLVLDLTGMGQIATKAKPATPLPPSRTSATWAVKASTPAPPRTRSPTARRSREMVIAIDAGHGGVDPGAVGRKGTKEKNVTLALARKLATLVDQEPGMRPVLIRDGDYFVALRDRITKAKQHKADLFISIHADASTGPYAGGSSVYVLSERGASSVAARLLAARENASDLVGGVSLDHKDHNVKVAMVDLLRLSMLDASTDLASGVLKRLKQVGKIHKQEVQSAGFLVLKSPDIPSVLVETAFISNPREENNLGSPLYQTQVARAIMEGVRSYCRNHPSYSTQLVLGN
jgi:N-acetylmuramoyl-L-alanine amidase